MDKSLLSYQSASFISLVIPSLFKVVEGNKGVLVYLDATRDFYLIIWLKIWGLHNEMGYLNRRASCRMCDIFQVSQLYL